MCERLAYRKKPNSKIDKCMRNLIAALNLGSWIRPLACCCGHGRYPMTIIVRDIIDGDIYELMSGKPIPRTRNFYKADAEGYYYIPEISQPKPFTKNLTVFHHSKVGRKK